jgi:hypothetical protein
MSYSLFLLRLKDSITIGSWSSLGFITQPDSPAAGKWQQPAEHQDVKQIKTPLNPRLDNFFLHTKELFFVT